MKSRIAPSANFKNPFGLLFRMLTSGKRAAYAALAHEAIRIASRPLDALLAGREARTISANKSSGQPVLLLVGAPRSGTTLAYQVLSRYLDVSYFSNLTSFFPRSPISGSQMFGWLARQHRADFDNFYGQTAGLSGPNDGFAIWNQWLGDDRFAPRTDLSSDELRSMCQFFDTWTATFGKPFLNKNNRNTSCLDQLCLAIPNARCIVIRRNPVLVAQSLIKAREQVQGDKNVGWGLKAHENAASEDRLAYVDDVCDQIVQIEQELDEQLSRIPSDRVVEVTYEGFCENPIAALREIVSQIPQVRLREDLIEAELKPFRVSSVISLTSDEHRRVLRRLEHYSGARESCRTASN
ncbi:MAG: sulfotransferase [Planctomycetaceae bacterium]|nr:sulfotransferase [Planctomycetaceae bacterium]